MNKYKFILNNENMKDCLHKQIILYIFMINCNHIIDFILIKFIMINNVINNYIS